MESQKPPWPSRTKRGARSELSDAEQDLQPLIDTSSPMSKPTSNKRRNLSTTLQKEEEEESLSSTPVSRLPNKKKTSNDQFNNSKTTAQCTTKSFRTSPQVSTSSARDLHPFWTKSKKEASRKLWSPTETDSLVSESTFLKVPSKNTEQYSTWFQSNKQTTKEPRKNSVTISSRFVTTLWPRTTEGESRFQC